MIINLGTVRPGSTLRIPFSSFDKDDGSSITMTNFAAADILVYKDGSTTERASTTGFTATTDFDSKTGKHLAIIDLADNTTAGFFAAGSDYLVAIDAVTVDGVTTGGWLARFSIGHANAWINTTIATLASQTSFTLTSGPAEDDALNGCVVILHDVASAVQCSQAIVSDYTGSTKTVTLAAAPTFTIATTDNVSVLLPTLSQANVRTALGMASADLDTQLDSIAAGVTVSTAPTREPIIAISASANGNITQTTPKNTTGKRFILVGVSSLATATEAECTPYDNFNNEYTLVDSDLWDGTNVKHWVFKCVNPATGPDHVLTVSTSSKSPFIAVAFLDDALMPDPTDQASTAVPSNGTSTQGGSITPAENGSYCISFIGLGVTTDPTCSGVDSYLGKGVNAIGNHIGGGVAVYDQATAAAFNPTWTHQSTQRIGRNYSFKPAVVDTAVVYANQFPAGYTEKVEQTGTEWLDGETEITGSFAYHETTPAKVQVQFYEAGTSEIAKPYVDLTGLLLGSNVFAGKTRPPAGGPWNYRVQSLDAQGNIIATSEQTSYDFYVGLRLEGWSQSNIDRLFDDYDHDEDALDGTILYSDNGWSSFLAGSPIIRLANEVRTVTGLPVAIIRSSIPGSAVTADPGNGSGYWLDRGANSPWGKRVTRMKGPKPRINALFGGGGEADAYLSATPDAWEAGVIEVSNRFNQLDGSIVAFVMECLGPLDDYDTDDVTDIRVRQAAMPDVRAHFYHGGNPIDGELADADPYHRDGPSYVRDCNRLAQGILFGLGFTELSARGPQALHAWRYAGQPYVYFNTTAKGLTQLTSGKPTALSVHDGGTVAFSAVTYSGSVARIQLDVAPDDNDVLTITNCDGKVPDITRLIYGTDFPGNDDRGMPLLPFTDLPVELRTAKSADDLVTKVELPLYPGIGSVGYTLRGRDGTLVQARTEETVSIVSVNERERTATYAAYCDQPSGLADGIAQWDDGETVAVDRLVDSRFNLLDDAVEAGSGGGGTPAQVHNEKPVPPFTATLGTRADGVTRAYPVLKLTKTPSAHIWIDCSKLLSDNIEDVTDGESDDEDVATVEDLGMYEKFVSIVLDTSGATVGDTVTITCEVEKIGPVAVDVVIKAP